MGIVVNDIVKMEWQENRFLQVKGTGKEKVFVLSCVDYQTPKGVVPVFFNPEIAWILEDDHGLFEFADVKDYLSNENDPMFPESMNECYILANVQGEIVNEEKIQKWGLEEYKADIMKRIKDVAPYAEEKEVQITG